MHIDRITKEQELQKAFEIRKAVFVKEQGVAAGEEFDQYDRLDGKAEHVLARYDDFPAGTGRIREVDGAGKLERICVLQPYRKSGLGKRIMEALEEIAADRGMIRVKLHAQTHAEGFYERLGYTTTSDVFLEEGIPHVRMEKQLL